MTGRGRFPRNRASFTTVSRDLHYVLTGRMLDLVLLTLTVRALLSTRELMAAVVRSCSRCAKRPRIFIALLADACVTGAGLTFIARKRSGGM